MKNGILKRFMNDKKGSAYVMAAFAIVPIFGMASLAIDYTNKDRMVTELETAAETVALHVAKRVALNPNESAQTFVDEGKSLMASLTDLTIDYSQFTVDMSSGKVKINVKAEIDTYFMHMFGHDTLEARSKTQAQFGRLNVDVALGIDNSGSMRHTVTDSDGSAIKKIDAAKKAAKLLITTASASVEDLTNTDLRFSIVPWHSHVSLPTDQLRTGASEGDGVDVGTWKSWVDWDGRSTNHFNYLAPYKNTGGSDHGEMFYEVNSSHEWEDYEPGKLNDVIPLENDGDGVDLNTMEAEANIGIVTRYDVFNNTDTAFNGCFEHRAGDYRYDFSPPTVDSTTVLSSFADPANDPEFDGDSLFVPNMAPDERDGYSSRNDYVTDDAGESDSSGSAFDEEVARVMNSAKYANVHSDDVFTDSNDNPNGSCNTAKVLPLSDDIEGINNYKITSGPLDPEGDLVQAIDAMDSNGFTDQSIGLEWSMHSLTPWEPLDQGGEFEDTQKILVFMTDGYNETRNKNDYKESYMSFQYPRDDVWDEYTGQPTGTQINYEINEATKRYCTKIKERGVKIYYIYFGTPNADATAIKDHCASTPEAAIEATNGAELEAAFEKIGDDIGKLRLTHYQD